MKAPTVYILTNKPNGTLYIGVTSNLPKRLEEHRQSLRSQFARKYNLHRLVYLSEFSTMTDAIAAEKRLKSWRRQWKVELIESLNPDWKDLRGS